MSRFARSLLAVLALACLPAAATRADENKVVSVLFESRHLDLVGAGQQVTYRFERKSNNEAILGPNFADTMRLSVIKANEKGERDLEVNVFTGPTARDPQHYPEMTVNPLFQWYLTRGVITMSSLAGGSQMYFKGKFRDALGKDAKYEDIKADYQGKQVDAAKITVSPFTDDPNGAKMQGYQHAVFTMVVSKDVPGYLLDLKSSFVSSSAAGPSIEEHIALVGMGETK